jgi:cyclohexa-1,5-dienecarbonyl-CoA hydratase
LATQSPTRLSRITIDFNGTVARIALSNPPLNIIDIAMMEELAQGLTEIESRSDVSVVVIGGLGKAFSVGVDVAAHTPDRVGVMLAKFHAVIRTLVGTKKVTIAAVHGHCLGGGAELALVCDLVYTAESATWGFPEIKLGCYPPVAVTALAALIGPKHAADLILTGRTISGSEAANIGLANCAVTEAEVASAVQEVVTHLSQLSPTALAITKKAIYAWDSMHFDKGLARAEKIYLEELTKMKDAQEGIAAFLQKREPAWKRR